jgi:NADPH2:quinone reductase
VRAIVCQEYGPIDRLRLVDIPEPELDAGHVRVAVTATGVNYVDTLIVQGRYQVKLPTPFVPGWECVGRVIEVADDVPADRPDVTVGVRVLVTAGSGAYAEQAVAPARSVRVLPDGISDPIAATFMQSYMTGLFALDQRAHAAPGQTLLVIGAGSGVGLAAVDVGRMLGLRVFAVASSDDKRELARSRGAEVAFDVDADVKSAIRELVAPAAGVDLVYDPVGGHASEQWVRSLGDGGQYLVIGFVGGIGSVPLNHVLLRNRSVVGVDWGGWAGRHQAENASMLDRLMAAIADGRLDPVEPTAYPLERTVDALTDLAERRAAGKLVVLP